MSAKNLQNPVSLIWIDQQAWPADVMTDLISYLRSANYHKTAEHLSDTLLVFEAERRSDAIGPRLPS